MGVPASASAPVGGEPLLPPVEQQASETPFVSEKYVEYTPPPPKILPKLPTSYIINWGIRHAYNGVDLANRCGTPIYAWNDGKVIVSQAGWNGGYGTYIIIKHYNGTQTLYSHLSKLSVSVGKTVEKGDLIGLMGTTGRSTGCHLHFEVRGGINLFVYR